MLILFKVKNYTSFKDEAVLDMRAASYVQHPSHVIKADEKTQLLKVAALYGANASGKSNFISAMFFFEQYIFSQFINKKDNNNFDDYESKSSLKLEQFELSENINDKSEFEIIFLHNNKQFQFGFECNSNCVFNEWLYVDDKKVYEREADKVTYGSQYKNMLATYTKLPESRLYLAVLEYFLEEKDRDSFLNDFMSFFTEEFNVFIEILFESTVKGYAGRVMLSKKLVSDENYKKQVEGYLKLIDVGIKRLDIKTEKTFNEHSGKKEEKKIVYAVHNLYNDEGKIVGEKAFVLRQESSGTLRFLTYIQNIINMISNGGVFIVDELSARLHPLLTKLIVDMFCSAQNTKAQLIFTTHDISLLNKDQFRRDEIVFIDKNEKGESTLYSLCDLKVRDDATFNKEYLQGKYGAIPIFDYDSIVGDKNE